MIASIYLYGTLTMGILGAVFAAVLVIISRVFAVETDPKVEEIEDILPGANCGACGEPGCSSFAEAVVDGRAPIEGCPVGGMALAEKIGEILGETEMSKGTQRRVAHVLCNGTKENTENRSRYEGISSCEASENLQGGHAACPNGCLGLGDCVEACPFGAAEMDEDGLPRFDPEECTGCGRCVEACPRDIVTLAPVTNRTHIRCSVQLPAKEARKICKVSCIGCRQCVKACPEDAIKMEGKLAVLDYEKCKHHEECVAVCPMNTIHSIPKEQRVES